MLQEHLFRFLTVRPGNRRRKIEREPKTVPVYDATRLTPLGDELRKLREAGGGNAEFRRVVRSYQDSAAHVKSANDLPLNLGRALHWIAANSNRLVKDLDLPAAIKKLHGNSPADVIKSADFSTALARVSDTLVAEAFAPSWDTPTDGLATARKWLTVIGIVARKEALDGELPLGQAIAELLLSVPDFAVLPAPAPQEPAPPSPPRDGEEKEREKLRERLRALEVAHREIARRAVDENALVLPQPQVDTAPKIADLERRLSTIETARMVAAPPSGETGAQARPALLDDGPSALRETARLTMKPEAIARLSDVTKRALAETQLDLSRTEATEAVGVIEEEMRIISEQLVSAQVPQTMLLVGGTMVDKQQLAASFYSPAAAAMPLHRECHFLAGVGDLLMVRQTLKAYELAEFAHVENVLAGEARVREHRRLNVREDIQIDEEERETERERNLQSTERNEMQAEAEKTVKSQFQLEAGLQVSGSYGPTVSFSASLNAGFSTSVEETQRKAVSYSREVTEKTSERVRERVKRELRRRMLEQVEELNRHSITNEPASNGHVRGIYRWLNKVYDAQILNYGQRMMFEFVVPEPAAYLLYALVENPPGDSELVKPVPPTHLGGPLKPSHLTRTNYLDFVARYGVRNVPAPPPAFQHVSVFDKQDKVQDGSMFGRATKVEIPAGYEAYAATLMSDYTYIANGKHSFRVMVGGTSFNASNQWGAEYKSLSNRYRELGIAYKVQHALVFAIAIDIHCRLTTEGFGKWQQAAFDAIMEAYLIQKADYEEKLAALAIQQGVKVLGRNPLENRRIEREELKKLVLMMLAGTTSIARNSMLASVEPLMDLVKACVNGNWIRFFENAFEWNNLMYVFYPYFWGRKARWIAALHFTDPDPDFAAFLRAGAARVQVPVRPGFEKAVAHFLQFGTIWEGNDPPLRDDDLYVPIVAEIAENLGRLDAGVPYPDGAEPWEVRIPTSLVLVQNLEEIPGIRDALTGGDVNITS